MANSAAGVAPAKSRKVTVQRSEEEMQFVKITQRIRKWHKDEMEARCAASHGDLDESRILRDALTEYFERHPRG